ncbi:Hypothetical predicted protein, partial [Paramuricea clavata]
MDPKCKQLYNPDDKISAEFNTMACEQTFVWASRFKKIICPMPHLHRFFLTSFGEIPQQVHRKMPPQLQNSSTTKSWKEVVNNSH